MKEYAIGQSRILVANLGAAVQILETIRFILFRDDPFTRGHQSNVNLREVSRQYPCLVTGVLFQIQI